MNSTHNTENKVGFEIFRQLGAQAFAMITGSSRFTVSKDALSFSVGSNAKRVNYCRIQLAADDTYTVTFANFRACKLTVLSEAHGIYCDQLLDIFEQETGLYATLKPRR